MFIGKKQEAQRNAEVNLKTSYEVNSLQDNLYFQSIKDYTDLIFPSSVDVLHPSHICVDGAYITILLCIAYPYNVRKGWLDEIINFGEGVEIGIYHAMQDKSKMIKDITTALGFTKHKIKEGGDNQVDSGVQQNALKASLYMKEELSKEDELYFINTFVKITADSPEALNDKLRRVESRLQSKSILSLRADCRQLEAFCTTLPIDMMDNRMEKQTRKNVLSSGLAAFYPFMSSSLTDDHGMFIGYNDHDNTPAILDQFNTAKYSNANAILCGRSGTGKTFLTQMLGGRFRMQKIPVMMICPLKGHEYKKLCNKVGGNYVRFAPGEKNNINIMDIRPVKFIGEEKASYLAEKLQKLKLAFSLIIPDMTTSELRMLDAPLKRTYEAKGITMENASIYENIAPEGKVSLRPRVKQMPILEDAQKEIAKVPALERIANELEPLITGSLSNFNQQTNIDLDSLYTVSDITDMPTDLIAFAMYVILDVYWDNIKMDLTQKKVVVMDELWKLIGTSGNAAVAEDVLNIFKTIRGYGGAAIGTTQDIVDFMMLEDGKYGKGIINASSIKIVLGLEAHEAAKIGEVLKLSSEEIIKIEKFKRGQGLILAGPNHFVANFTAFKTEERLINTDREKLLSYQNEAT